MYAMVAIVCLGMMSGCAMLTDKGITNNVIVRGIAIREAQAVLVKEGVVMSETELGDIYDTIVESEAAMHVAATVESNASASNAVRAVIEKYMPMMEVE